MAIALIATTQFDKIEMCFMLKKLFPVAIFLLFLSGCAVDSGLEYPNEYVYTTQEVTYSEGNAQYFFRGDMDFTETEQARFYFDPSIEKTERHACMEATAQILSEQTAVHPIPEIYVFSENQYSRKCIFENKLYISLQDWQSTEYATDVLLAAYGASSHYGLAFGYANLLSSEFRWGNPIEGQYSIPGVLDVCDLNLLCFDKAFASKQDVAAAQQLACDFVNAYVAECGEEALQQLLSVSDTADGMESVKAVLSAYYQKNGLVYEPSAIRYGYGGVSFGYIVYSDLGAFYLGREWTDVNRDVNPLVSDGFLHENYVDTKAFYEINLRQMEQYQELFALDSYNNDLSIIFSNSESRSQYSFYQSGTHTIFVKNVDSLMHEYIHAMTQPNLSMDDWKIEGFARYFSYRYDCYGIAFLNEDYNNAPNSAETRYVYEYLETIDRPIDMAIDYAEIENIAVYSRSYKDPNASYVAGSSFVQYLIAQYGEKAVARWIYGDGEPLPKPYGELVDGWNDYIGSAYQEYSKYQ